AVELVCLLLLLRRHAPAEYKPVLPFSFFFSRRRRHTRFSRDWSSDVCSSDLLERHLRHEQPAAKARAQVGAPLRELHPEGHGLRSEERRVGKEGLPR